MSKKYKYRKSFTYEGKRYNVFGNTLDEVYEKKAAKLAELKSDQVVYTGDMTVKQWTEQAIRTYKVNVKPSVLKDSKSRINKHIISAIGHKSLKSVTAIECQQILNSQIGMSQSHITKLYQELQFIFRTAAKNRLIQFDPTETLVKPSGTKGHRRSLTDKERYHFIEVCKHNNFILFELMFYCGCRPSEAMRAIGKDIMTIDGKLMLHIRGTKTVNSDRYVPIPDVLADRLINISPFEPIAQNGASEPHNKDSYRRLTERLKREMNLSMGCRTYRNALIPPYPLSDDFVPYNFRHTYCTDLARAGVDIRTAQRLMGHANISITADIYTHVDKRDIISAAMQIDAYLKAGNV